MARKQASTPSRTASSQQAPQSTTTQSPAPSSTTTTTSNASPIISTKPTSSVNSSSLALQDILPQIYNSYLEKTPQRTKLIDAFMGFLLVVGGIQFLYCILFGNYPYNAFLSGFGITVGQFVLTASLRIQTTKENEGEFKSVSPERAFADYVLGSLVLHFFCVNFIN